MYHSTTFSGGYPAAASTSNSLRGSSLHSTPKSGLPSASGSACPPHRPRNTLKMQFNNTKTVPAHAPVTRATRGRMAEVMMKETRAMARISSAGWTAGNGVVEEGIGDEETHMDYAALAWRIDGNDARIDRRLLAVEMCPSISIPFLHHSHQDVPANPVAVIDGDEGRTADLSTPTLLGYAHL
ncbi:hypothetical protein B0H11DRAFT_1939368 [Mycena galericulata]|nr:hypothetical protein B0H11DRAFT_1939368 [Mycena galericulata]